MLEVRNISISFGGLKALNKLTFSYSGRGIYSIIGPNGAGKTTLFNIITAIYKPDMGRIFFNGKDITSFKTHRIAKLGLSRTFQQAQIFTELSIVENVMAGAHLLDQGTILSKMFNLKKTVNFEKKTRKKALEILDYFGFTEFNIPAVSLPYGRQRLLEIARILITDPKLILFDEPAAGLNINETEELSKILFDISSRGIGVILVEHDMNLVMNVSEKIIVLDYGNLIAEGTPREIRNNRVVIEAYLGGDF